MGIFDFFKKKQATDKKSKEKHFIIDDTFISTNGSMEIIKPLWYGVSIYDGPEKYEMDLKPFSLAQRYVFAAELYNAEVQNGGHDQFYSNSTGIVWEDAMNGLKAIGAQRQYKVIKESVKRMGGSPSKVREIREEEMEKHDPNFDDLDSKFYEFYKELDGAVMTYIKNNAKEFYFDGIVVIPF